ncbi:MAG: hypothetical protein ACJ79Y_12495, partial [Myxococcales bacterium]
TQMLPKEDRLNWNRMAVLDRIAMSMGGRIAEELEFNEITSGAKSDIDHATQFARSMVCEWGMSEKLGPLAFYEEQSEVFLGRDVQHRQRNFSEKTAIDIDEEVRSIITENEKRVTAIHEAGHALLAVMLPHAEPIHKVSIIPRGPALGLTQMLPKEDRLNWNRSAILDRIAMAMGGRLAEEIEFNEITSGAKSDIDHATQFARSMVCEWGMSEKLGPLAFYEEQGEVFLGRDVQHRQRNFSEKTAIDIDEEVRAIITEQYRRARIILVENKPVLDRIALALLERETLDGEQVDQLVKGKTLAPPSKPAPPAMPVEPKRPEEKKSKILDALGGLGTPLPRPEPTKA